MGDNPSTVTDYIEPPLICIVCKNLDMAGDSDVFASHLRVSS